MFWPVIESVSIRKKENRHPGSNPDLGTWSPKRQNIISVVFTCLRFSKSLLINSRFAEKKSNDAKKLDCWIYKYKMEMPPQWK